MGTILSTRIKDDGKVILEIAMNPEEAIQLGGHMENIHVFSENMSSSDTNIAARGKNEATKYFLIPKELRKNFKFTPNKKIRCQKIETKTKKTFIYIIDRSGL